MGDTDKRYHNDRFVARIRAPATGRDSGAGQVRHGVQGSSPTGS